MAERLKQVIVRMPKPMHEAIKDRARQTDRTMSQVVRLAIRELLEGRPLGPLVETDADYEASFLPGGKRHRG